MRGDRALAGASNLLGYQEYTQQDLSTLQKTNGGGSRHYPPDNTSYLTYDCLAQAIAKHQYDTNSDKITNNNAKDTPY